MRPAEFHHRTSRGPSQAVSSCSPPNWSHGVLSHSAAGIPLPRDAISGYPDLYADRQRHRNVHVYTGFDPLPVRNEYAATAGPEAAGRCSAGSCRPDASPKRAGRGSVCPYDRSRDKTPRAASPDAAVAATGRIVRQPVADPLNARTPPRARATAFKMEICPGSFVKTLEALLPRGKTAASSSPFWPAKDVPGQALAGTVGRARPPRREAWRRGLRPRPRQESRPAFQPHPSEVASGRGELDGIGGTTVLRAVFDSGARLEPAVAKALRAHPDVRGTDRHLVLRSMAALCRWWGWNQPLHLCRWRISSCLPPCSIPRSRRDLQSLGQQGGRPCDRLMAVGDAPGWTARAEGLKRWVGGGPVTANPWLLFPTWFRDQLPVPPGDTPAKARRLAFLHALQTRLPLWVGVRGAAEKAIWNELREAGLKPWIHRRLTTAARFDPDTDPILRPCREGELAIDDLSSQALGKVCDPDPGDARGTYRWHRAALHLGALMENKGTVVTTFEHDKRRHETAIRLRRFPSATSPRSSGTAAATPGKPGSFEACSWMHPARQWETGAGTPTPLDCQAGRPAPTGRAPEAASRRCLRGRPSRRDADLSVATATVIETLDVITAFLGSHPEFRLDPFPHPLEESTTAGTLQLWPHLHDSEARFIARMVRKTSPT